MRSTRYEAQRVTYSGKRRTCWRSGTGTVAGRCRIRGLPGLGQSNSIRDTPNRVVGERNPSGKIIAVEAVRLTFRLGSVVERPLALQAKDSERLVDCSERPICRPDALGRYRAYYKQQNQQGSKQGGEEPSGGQDTLSFVTSSIKLPRLPQKEVAKRR